jgi:hypothetical protein
MLMMASGCAAQQEGDSAAPEERVSPQPVEATAAVEPTGEATEPLTYRQCYAVVFALAKAACLHTHAPLLDCLVVADGTARTACKSLEGTVE